MMVEKKEEEATKVLTTPLTMPAAAPVKRGLSVR